MTALMVNDEVVSRLEAVAAPEEDVTALAETAMMQFIARRERQAAGRAEMQAMLDGPRRPHTESMAEMRRKYSLPERSHLTHEELEEQGDAVLASLPPERIAEAERLGLI
jgi:predicted transcriptional regulator